MSSKEIVELALQEDDFDHLKLAKFKGFNEKQIEMVKLFWDPAFNGGWIYLSDEVIYDYFGYKKSESSSKNFYKTMKDNYIENTDYQEVSHNNEIIQVYTQRQNAGGKSKAPANKKYYIITGKTFKKMGMKANTKKGDEICDYFLIVEELCIDWRDIMNKIQLMLNQKELQEKDQQLQIANSKNLTLVSKLHAEKLHQVDGFVYWITSEQYAKQSHFRFGRTNNLTRRLGEHNRSRPDNDKM